MSTIQKIIIPVIMEIFPEKFSEISGSIIKILSPYLKFYLKAYHNIKIMKLKKICYFSNQIYFFHMIRDKKLQY